MTERLRPEDLAFLVTESASTPMHNATLEIFEPGGGFDYDRLVALIRERIAYVPRFRQRVRSVPGHLGNPVWVDDEAFDLGYHVRRSALPRPGTDEQLRELVARVQSRRLDQLALSEDPYAAAAGADVVVLLTEWPEFGYLDLDRLAEVMRGRAIVDTRNVLDPIAVRSRGLTYDGVGRR